MRRIIITGLLVMSFFIALRAHSQKILIYMDLKQTDHLKAYGVAYWSLERNVNVEWLLNYRGGSFLIDYYQALERELRLRGIGFSIIGAGEVAQIYAEIEENNMETVLLEKAPAIAIYQPPRETKWDDAVYLALDYAEVPFEKIWDKEVIDGELEKYDWVHLHHEDFTGQHGKFYANSRNAPWYIQMVMDNQKITRELGFQKVSELKQKITQLLKEYIIRGGFLFAMCSATDTIDIALAAAGTDICATVFDGDPAAPNCQQQLDFSQTLAFTKFQLVMNPMVYEFSDIDIPPGNGAPLRSEESDYFTLFEFSAKYDPVPTMLTQNHVSVVKGFMGQTTGFLKSTIKSSVVIMAETEGTEQVKYIHGNLGRGTFTFYAGHDPEDYRHYVGDPPTHLELHKNSPGYRLILNNILFPAAKKKKRKT
ncbi:asparagine synthetase B [candidate division KSB1 bacterium]|nr:asparagine synthetase B [candidate division KSB1 bacterium]